MKSFTTHSAQETTALGEIFAKDCRQGDVLAFFGGLGMGKTAFIKGLVHGLGICADVTSPTFSLVNATCTAARKTPCIILICTV